MAWLRISLSRLRHTPAPALGLALLTLATAFVCASLPRVLARDEDDVLRADVRAAPFVVRNLQLTQAARIGASADGGLGVVQATGDGLQEGLPGPVRTLVVARQTVVDTPRFTVSNRKLDLTTVRLRFQPGAEERVRLVDGRLPTSASRAVARPGGGEPLVAVEVALPVASARVLQAAVGDTLLLAVDGTDPLSLVVRGARAIDAGGSMAIDIVGTYEVADEADAFWYGDTSLARPTIRSLSSVTQAQDTTALAAPAAYRSAVGLADRVGFGIRYTWRSLIDPGRLAAAGLGDVIAGLRRMESVFPLATARVDLGKTSLASGLLGLLDAHGDRWASVQAVLAVAAVGAAAVAAAAVALVAVLAASRRRRSVAVWRGRGASRGQVLGSVAAEGLLLTLPSAATAALLAVALVPGGGVIITLGAAAAVSFLTTVVLVAMTAPATVGPPREGRAERETGRGPGPRRLVLEGVVVLLAISGAALLRERGVRGAGATGQLGGADPFIAAVPALVAVAAGLVAVRLFPVGTRLLAGLARARRDLVPVLALRRLMRGAGSGTILTVLLATAAVGGFSSATLLHLDGAAEAVAWQETGASFRLTSVDRGPLTGTFDPADLPGVQAVAAAYEGPANVAGQGVQVRLLAIDAAAYERVVGGTPADPQLPVALTVSASSGPDGSSAAPLPALVSQAVADGTAGTAGGSGGGSPLGVGAGFQLVLPGHQSSHSVSFRTVAVRGAFPSLPIGQAFVVIPRAAVLAAMPDVALPATAVYLRAADDAASAMRVALAHAPPGMVLASRAERTAALTASPMVRTVSDGMALAALLAAAYAALAVTAVLALTGAARAVEVAHLRALGLSRRETLGLVLVEHGPTVAFAFVAGAALGLGLFVLLRDGLGLGAVVGSPVSVPLRVEPAHLVIILAAIILIVALGIGLATALERRATLAASLRRGLE